MQPETTITKLADDLLKAIYDKFIKANEEEEDEEKDGEEEPLLKEQGIFKSHHDHNENPVIHI